MKTLVILSILFPTILLARGHGGGGYSARPYAPGHVNYHYHYNAFNPRSY